MCLFLTKLTKVCIIIIKITNMYDVSWQQDDYINPRAFPKQSLRIKLYDLYKNWT